MPDTCQGFPDYINVFVSLCFPWLPTHFIFLTYKIPNPLLKAPPIVWNNKHSQNGSIHILRQALRHCSLVLDRLCYSRPGRSPSSYVSLLHPQRTQYWLSLHTAVIIYDRRTPNPATEALNRLEKRSSSISLTCWTQTNCSGQSTGHSVSGFSSNQPCINAANCQCMVVTLLDNAHVAYWNGQACSGNKSILNGCFSNANVVQPSAGTNSLGFHTGCTGSWMGPERPYTT